MPPAGATASNITAPTLLLEPLVLPGTSASTAETAVDLLVPAALLEGARPTDKSAGGRDHSGSVRSDDYLSMGRPSDGNMSIGGAILGSQAQHGTYIPGNPPEIAGETLENAGTGPPRINGLDTGYVRLSKTGSV